jgi:hypothetical protein
LVGEGDEESYGEVVLVEHVDGAHGGGEMGRKLSSGLHV